jgi:hypothetical protein
MARKNRDHLLSITAHVAEPTKPTIVLFCPLLKCKGSRDIAYCLYKCPKSRLVKCKEYLRVYPEILNFEMDPKYTEKYGEVIIPVPSALRKRRVRRAKII